MANYYKLDSGKNWDSPNAWSDSSGGDPVAGYPEAGDTAIFDAASLGINVTINIEIGGCNLLFKAGYDGDVYIAGSWSIGTISDELDSASTIHLSSGSPTIASVNLQYAGGFLGNGATSVSISGNFVTNIGGSAVTPPEITIGGNFNSEIQPAGNVTVNGDVTLKGSYLPGASDLIFTCNNTTEGTTDLSAVTLFPGNNHIFILKKTTSLLVPVDTNISGLQIADSGTSCSVNNNFIVNNLIINGGTLTSDSKTISIIGNFQQTAHTQQLHLVTGSNISGTTLSLIPDTTTFSITGDWDSVSNDSCVVTYVSYDGCTLSIDVDVETTFKSGVLNITGTASLLGTIIDMDSDVSLLKTGTTCLSLNNEDAVFNIALGVTVTCAGDVSLSACDTYDNQGSLVVDGSLTVGIPLNGENEVKGNLTASSANFGVDLPNITFSGTGAQSASNSALSKFKNVVINNAAVDMSEFWVAGKLSLANDLAWSFGTLHLDGSETTELMSLGTGSSIGLYALNPSILSIGTTGWSEHKTLTGAWGSATGVSLRVAFDSAYGVSTNSTLTIHDIETSGTGGVNSVLDLNAGAYIDSGGPGTYGIYLNSSGASVLCSSLISNGDVSIDAGTLVLEASSANTITGSLTAAGTVTLQATSTTTFSHTCAISGTLNLSGELTFTNTDVGTCSLSGASVSSATGSLLDIKQGTFISGGSEFANLALAGIGAVAVADNFTCTQLFTTGAIASDLDPRTITLTGANATTGTDILTVLTGATIANTIVFSIQPVASKTLKIGGDWSGVSSPIMNFVFDNNNSIISVDVAVSYDSMTCTGTGTGNQLVFNDTLTLSSNTNASSIDSAGLTVDAVAAWSCGGPMTMTAGTFKCPNSQNLTFRHNLSVASGFVVNKQTNTHQVIMTAENNTPSTLGLDGIDFGAVVINAPTFQVTATTIMDYESFSIVDGIYSTGDYQHTFSGAVTKAGGDLQAGNSDMFVDAAFCSGGMGGTLSGGAWRVRYSATHDFGASTINSFDVGPTAGITATFLNNPTITGLLTINPGCTIYWKEGGTLSSDTFSATGTELNPIVMRSAVDDTAWLFNLTNAPAASAIQYVSVRDSNAAGGVEIPATYSSNIDLTGNTNWAFATQPPTVSSVSANIELAHPTAEIYYTTDGSTPDTGSTLYTTPIVISTFPTTLKYVAWENEDYSEVVTKLIRLQTQASGYRFFFT